MAITMSTKAKSCVVNCLDSSLDVEEFGPTRRRKYFLASNGNQHTRSSHTHMSSPQVKKKH